MEEEDPKPCPVCGAPAEHLEKNGHFLFCPNEDCQQRPCTHAELTKADAIAAWNKDETY